MGSMEDIPKMDGLFHVKQKKGLLRGTPHFRTPPKGHVSGIHRLHHENVVFLQVFLSSNGGTTYLTIEHGDVNCPRSPEGSTDHSKSSHRLVLHIEFHRHVHFEMIHKRMGE